MNLALNGAFAAELAFMFRARARDRVYVEGLDCSLLIIYLWLVKKIRYRSLALEGGGTFYSINQSSQISCGGLCIIYRREKALCAVSSYKRQCPPQTSLRA